MKKTTIALAALVATAGLAQADVLVVDVSGFASWGFEGDAMNETLAVALGAGASITSIDWDVNLTTFDISWADENTMTFEGSTSVNPGAGDAFTVFNMNYMGSTGGVALSADGVLNIEFHEVGFDDVFAGIDSIYEDGSTITITYTPAPSALAVLGLGGLVAGRRRR